MLFRQADVLILDEPTAVLTPQEVTEFFGIVNSLRDAGKALVFITHKLHEVREVADRIDVLRAGAIVGEADPKTASDAELAELMVGRPVDLSVEKKPAAPADVQLEAKDLSVLNEREEFAVRGVDLAVRAGEIVGIAGVQGNGQTELVEAITGMRPVASGTLTFLGTDITHASTRDCHKLGMAHIPEDRHRSGMIGEFTIAENMVLNTYYDKRFSDDVGSIEYVHDRIVQARDGGAGVLVVSTELEEVLALSDRILVMFRGRIVKEFGPGSTAGEVGLAMAGVVS